MTKRKPKTLFEHLGLTKGKAKAKLPPWLMSTIKLLSIAFVAGLTLDIILNYNKLSIVVPLLMMMYIILKVK